jgi:hypothetical protein
MIDLMIDALQTSPASPPLIYPNPYYERNRSKEIFFAIAVLQISRYLHVRRDIFFATVAHVGPGQTLRHAHRRARLLDDGGLFYYTHTGGNITP